MRSHHKRQILEIITTFKEANTEIRRLFLDGNKASILQLLADMQDSVIKTGEFIEGLEGEGTRTVALLEEYYEDLYHVAEEIETIDVSFVNCLQKHLTEIENSVRTEFRADRMEIVFFPYKASMWDSLESIYLVAKEDPQCDVYCVPIPYFELTPDGKLGQMHYEGADYYPDDIEITNWQEYDIKGRRPDVVFIHYAYDNMVRNATIHPDFYSKNLREHCEHLVYVPYFITPEKTVEEYNAYLPGVLHADSVIVQSEEIRQSYIQHYKEFNKKKNLNFYYGRAESKFVALGSPKLDKVKNIKDTDYELPTNWKDLLYNENGEKKKVILYNTHMFAWLQGGERYFNKLRAVFEAFKDRRDVVLWWRPHPNTELNFRTFRPDLLNDYFSTVESYKSEAWGIYDDTPDLHRAIALCDAYYGDKSSITELIKAAGKPIFYQVNDSNGEMPAELLHPYFWFHLTNIFEACGELYGVTYNGYLFKLADKSFSYESEITVNPNLPRGRNYFTQVTDGGNIIFIPHNERQIAVYNTKTKEQNGYPLELKEEYLDTINGADRSFYDGILYKNKIFFVPGAYRSIVAFNFDTGETEHCLSLLDLFPKWKMHSVSFGWTWLNESTVLLASLYSNEVLEFNLDTYAHRIHKLGRENQSFHHIFRYGDNFFLIGRQPFMLKWNYETGEVTIFDEMPEDFQVTKKLDWVFIPVKPYKSKLILLGGFTNMILEFDLDTCEYRKLDAFDEILNHKVKADSNADYPFATCHYMLGDSLYFVNKNEALYRYDFEKQTIEAICEIAPAITPDACHTLNSRFIDSIIKGEYQQVQGVTEENNKLQDGQSGRRIYEFVKARVLK
jgi:hypothetical protein